MLSPEERKRRSEEICKREGVPINSWLPFVEDEANAKLREINEIAWRAMCLCLVAMKGGGMSHTQASEIADSFGLNDKLSPKESIFLNSPDPSDRERVNFSWRYEAYWVLLWALQYIDELERPDHTCDVERAVRIMYEAESPLAFINGAKLRELSTILDQVDLIYRYDWACVDARLKGVQMPSGLHAGVVYERHYAFNWLVSYCELDWDDISTDT